MDLAPIVIFTFNRLEHTINTINSLKDNDLANESNVFIFSDGPRNEGEKLKVNAVRNYLKTVEGFNSIKIIESNINKGLASSVIDGVTSIINKYGKVIVLEDDLITSKYFLRYMNESLNLFKDRDDIWSISGYTPDIYIPDDYNDNIYLTYRGCSWGWGTWKNRWNGIDWDIMDYDTFIKDSIRKKKFNMSGNDLTSMLTDQINGRINSWAIRWCYNQFNKKKFTVYPVESLVKNNGTDASGTHCSNTKKFDVNLSQKVPNLRFDIKLNEEIAKSFKKKYDLDILGYTGVFLRKIGLYNIAKKLRNFLF